MQVILPTHPERPGVQFYTYAGTTVATGYSRVVHGGRGPYVEFTDGHINLSCLVVPADEAWRLTSNSPHFYYWEYRTNDTSWVKIYRQRRLVDYADYQVGLWYISPFDLHASGYGDLIHWGERT